MADKRSFDSTLHDIVYSIDTGTGLKIIRVGLYVLLLLIIVMVYTATQFRGLKTEESMDLAQLGRNLSVQNGMVTKYVRPLSMWKMSTITPNEDARIENHPDLFHPPAYPAVLATGFMLFDAVGLDPFAMPEGGRGVTMSAEQWVVLPVNHLFTILTGWVVFALGKRLFSREIGFMAMTIYYLSNVAWQDSISGLNISMAVFFIVAAYYTMVVAMLNKRDGERPVWWIVPFLLSIACAGVAFLTRYIAIAAVPGLCLFAWLMGGRFRGGTRFVLIFVFFFAMLISPWLARNYRVCGNPLGMAAYTALADTSKYPGNALERNVEPELSAKSSIAAIKEKWMLNYSGTYSGAIPSMGGGVLMAFFLTTFFYQFIRPQVNYLRWGILLSLLLTVIIGGFFSESSINMMHAFWPFVVLYGLAFFYILIDRLDLGVRLYMVGLKCLIVLLAAIPFGLTLLPPHEGNSYPPYHAPLISKVSEMLNPREAMCTDMPWATAWYGDRVSILLPKDVDQFYFINDYRQYISGLYVTTITKNKPFVSELLDGPEQSWLPIISGRVPPDFPLKQGVSLNRQDQIFFSDRNRWATGAEQGTPAAQ
jgi:hypothetical protein